MQYLAGVFERLGRYEEAERIHRFLTEIGYAGRYRLPSTLGYEGKSDAIVEFSEFLLRTGCGTEAERVRKYCSRVFGRQAALVSVDGA
jgi:hypothetical protein